jgi:hypothetical protein
MLSTTSKTGNGGRFPRVREAGVQCEHFYNFALTNEPGNRKIAIILMFGGQ